MVSAVLFWLKIAEAVVAGKTLAVALRLDAPGTEVSRLGASWAACPPPPPDHHPSSAHGTLPFRRGQSCPVPLCFEKRPTRHTQFDQPHCPGTGTPAEYPGAEALTPADREPPGLSPLRAGQEGLAEYTCVCTRMFPSCVTFFDPMDCSAPGSSVHVILQARILEWVAMSSSRGSSQARD